MAEPVVHVADLRKTFDVPEREAGLKAASKGLIRRRMREVKAVDGITFDIAPGEVVGFLGPNGAGKTTTLKMLSGLLYVTSGEARVLADEVMRARVKALSARFVAAQADAPSVAVLEGLLCRR